MRAVENQLPPPRSQSYLNLGSPLSAISSSPDGTKLIVAGRDIVKIVSLDGNEPKIINNLRAGKTQSLNYTGNDCCWHPSNLENYKFVIATAATNGVVVIWNTTREGSRSVEKVLNEHTRAVNKLAWHPEKMDCLLTGSQDATLRYWDIRDPNPTKIIFQPKSESVRDVQFNPFNTSYFAAAFDNGTVQLWDYRKNTGPVEKITAAHQGLVLAIDWHPEERNIIASGGRDRCVRIWDLSSPGGKSLNNVTTISSVSRIKWRPGYKWHIASCSSIVDLQTHIWDVKKPYIPIASFREHRDVPTGLLWQNPNQLISCSKDSYLMINNIKDAYRPHKHIRTTGLTWNIYNELALVNEKINRNLNDPTVQLASQFPSFFASFNVATTQPLPQSTPDPKGIVSVHSPLFQKNEYFFLFEYFAKNYKFTGMPFQELCDHNERTSLQVKQFHISKIWSLIKLHFQDDFEKQQQQQQQQDQIQEQQRQQEQLELQQQQLQNQQQQGQQSKDEKPSDEDHKKSVSHNLVVGGLGESGDEIKDDSLGSDFYDHHQHVQTSNTLFDDGEEESIFLSAEAVTPLAPLPTRAPSPSNSKLDKHHHHHHHHHLNEKQQSSVNLQKGFIQNKDLVFSDNHFLLNDSSNSKMFNNSSSLNSSANNLSLNDSGNQQSSLLTFLEIPEFDFQPILIEMLNYCIEKGDVQTCVFVVLVLKSALKIDQQKQSQWFSSYIELLQRYKLWTYATEIMKNCSDPAISQMSQKHTSFISSCSHCGKTIPQNSLVCEKCTKVASICSICRLPVKGSFVWCQGCGHGGHLQHLKSWFDKNDHCPSGCSHICKPLIKV
eukprot:gene1973-2427_t